MAHPLRIYLDGHDLTVRALVDIVARRGAKVSANYVAQILGGHRRPGGALACALADATNGRISVDDLLRYQRTDPVRPTKRRRTRKARRAVRR